jgi:AraC family transcriptional regulator
LHVRLSRTLLLSAAERITGIDLAGLRVRERRSLHDPVVAEVGRALWGELECPSPAGALYANTAAHFLAAHLLRFYSSLGVAMREPPQRLSPPQTQRVVDFVQSHLNQDLSLDTLAQHTGFSAYHFARLFRSTIGESPHQYVLRQRVERAQALLQRSDLSLAEVALATGFAHQSHLTQQFKRHVGVTPSAYRREQAPRAHGAGQGRERTS